MFLTSLVCVTMYFNKWRPIAVGVASCGSGVGIFIFPVLIRAILDHYGWEQTILIQAGFVLMGVLLGMTFLPIETKHRQKKGFKTALKSAFDVSLLKDPIFIILAIMAVTSTIGKQKVRSTSSSSVRVMSKDIIVIYLHMWLINS